MFNRLKNAKNNSINYNEIINHPDVRKNILTNIKSDINIFIPVKNRTRHLNACLAFFQKAEEDQLQYNINIYVLENDTKPRCLEIARKFHTNYIFIPTSITNCQDQKEHL